MFCLCQVKEISEVVAESCVGNYDGRNAKVYLVIHACVVTISIPSGPFLHHNLQHFHQNQKLKARSKKMATRQSTLTGRGYTEVKNLPAWEEVYAKCKSFEELSKQHVTDAERLGIDVEKLEKYRDLAEFKPILNVPFLVLVHS